MTGRTSDSSLCPYQERRTREGGVSRVSSANKTSYWCSGWKYDHLSILTVIFSASKKSPWEWAEVAGSVSWCSRGWESHLWVGGPQTTAGRLVSRLDHPCGYSLAPSGSTQVGAWIETHRGASCNSHLFLSASFYLSLVLIPALLPCYLENFLFVSFKFCGWQLCAVLLCGQLLLQVSANTVGTTEHFSLEMHSPHCLRLQPWVTQWSGVLKKRQELEHFPPLLPLRDYSAWALRMAWFISSPPDWGKIKKRTILNLTRKAW